MRLAGATRKNVSLLAATESTAAAILGVAPGSGSSSCCAPGREHPVHRRAVLPRRADTQPAGHSRGRDRRARSRRRGGPASAAPGAHLPARRRPPGDAEAAGRLADVPLLAGLAELGFLTRTVTRPPSRADPGVRVQLRCSSRRPGHRGPGLTMAAARVMARWTSRPGTLIAARRLADDPKAAFRAVSGLVLALFITTVAVVAITTQDAKDLTRFGSAAEANMLTDQIAASSRAPAPARRAAGPAAPAAPLVAQLAAIPGVQGVVVVRVDPGRPSPGHSRPRRRGTAPSPVPAGVISCAQLATVPALGRCPAGATTAAFPETGSAAPLLRPGLHRIHLAGRERPGRAAGQPQGGPHLRGDGRHRAGDRAGEDRA